jgi:prenyltransferase beta subunit
VRTYDLLVMYLDLIEVCLVWVNKVEALQEYVLDCCQNVNEGDKPEKYPDFYHSCYCLPGLSISQHIYIPMMSLPLEDMF